MRSRACARERRRPADGHSRSTSTRRHAALLQQRDQPRHAAAADLSQISPGAVRRYFPHWGLLSWIMNALDIPMSDFSRGEPYQQPLAVAGQRVAVNICYEDVFGEEIIRQLPRGHAARQLHQRRLVRRLARLRPAPADRRRCARRRPAATCCARPTPASPRSSMSTGTSPPAPSTSTVLEGHAQGFTGSTPYVIWANWPVLASASLCSCAAARRFAMRKAAKRETALYCVRPYERPDPNFPSGGWAWAV